MRPLSVYESVVPRPRGPLPQVCGLVISVACFLLAGLCESDQTSLFQTTKQVLYGLCVGVVFHGGCLIVEEATSHFKQRHNGSVKDLLKACVSWRAQAVAAVLALACVLRGAAPNFQELGRVLLIAASYLLLKTTGVLAPSEVEISEICESRHMNVAHGLAWSFYQGYLKLVLPSLDARVAQYNEQRPRDPAEGALRAPWAPRLHILLPLSASVSARLEDEDSRVRFHDSLPPLEIDRAGIRNRVYKNSIYSVRDSNGQVHKCILESATPLLTLYQMSQESSAAFGLSDRRQQVVLFYTTLQNILENSLECRNRYRLILLDDTRTGEDHLLSTEILKHLQQQSTEEFYLEPPTRATPAPVEETEPKAANGKASSLHMEPMSSTTLMISSEPKTLRVPEENSEC